MFEATFENRDMSIDAQFSDGMENAGTTERIRYGPGLKFDVDTRTLSVDVATEITEGDTRPISSDTLWQELHALEELLKDI